MDRHSRCDFRPFALIAVTLALAVTDVGCATRRGPGPGAPPREIPLPTDGARADEVAELRQALEVYSLSQPAAGQQALEAFIKKHPKSPQVALAAALLARVMLHQGDVIGARALLERRAADSPDPAARFIRGLAEARGGQPQQALALLQPFAEPGPPPLGPEPDEAELSLRAALGDARLATGDVAGAFAEWDHYLRQSNVRESEKAFARQRADEMAARVSPEAAAQAYRSSKSELARAALGPRAAAGLRARGDNDTARSLEEESGSLRRSLGFSTGAGGSGPGDPHRLGLLAPFSGPAFLLGEVVLRGAMLAIGEAGRSGEPAQFQIVARDAAEGAGGRAAFELVREEQAIGVVGVGDRRAVEGALADGVPVLLLDEGLPGSGRTAFQVLHTPEARAAELARRALGLGARRFAILAPDTPTGRRLADAFSRAASAQGGRITARASYAAGASAFTGADRPAEEGVVRGGVRGRGRTPAGADRPGAGGRLICGRRRSPVARRRRAPPAPHPAGRSCCCPRRSASAASCCGTLAATCRVRCSRLASTPTPKIRARAASSPSTGCCTARIPGRPTHTPTTPSGSWRRPSPAAPAAARIWCAPWAAIRSTA